KPSVLAIEDDQPLCWLIERILSEDFDVTIKREGISAMEWLLEGNIPSIILCDFVLPKIDGLEFLENLTKSGAFNKVPVIMFSSVLDENFPKKCIDAGASAFLEKPFDPPALIKTINEVLEKNKISAR
ncbi:response regulator, partial [Fulvivirga sp. RKSG066]|uniref:response regulator n=1 Tax=Fulvivirga aurantia TaxID=2529383 RepID=UPI0012BCC33E